MTTATLFNYSYTPETGRNPHPALRPFIDCLLDPDNWRANSNYRELSIPEARQ